jgi:hypothetical protein
VSTAPHHQAQIIVADEIDRRDHVISRLRRDGIDAGLRGPGIHPARGLGQARVIADIVGILQLLEDVAAGNAIGRFLAHAQRRSDLDEATADLRVQPLPLRLGRPSRLPRANARKRLNAGLGGCYRQTVQPHPRRRLERQNRLREGSSLHPNLTGRYFVSVSFSDSRNLVAASLVLVSPLWVTSIR